MKDKACLHSGHSKKPLYKVLMCNKNLPQKLNYTFNIALLNKNNIVLTQSSGGSGPGSMLFPAEYNFGILSSARQ